MNMGEVREVLADIQEFTELTKTGITGYSLGDRTFTLCDGTRPPMSDFGENLIKLTLQNIQLNHQPLVLDMALTAFQALVQDVKMKVEEL